MMYTAMPPQSVGAPPAAADAGIGKTAIDPAERVQGGFHRGLDGSGIGDVADPGIDFTGTGRHGCGGTLVLLAIAAPDRDVAALRVQRLRDAKADTAIAAGDDRRAAGEIKNAHGMFPFAVGRDKSCAQWRADVLRQAWTSAPGKSNMGRDIRSSAQRNSA